MTTPFITRLEEAATPKPGSDAAIDGGCTCPVSDNRRGQGIQTDVGTCFYYSGDCPMHSHPANHKDKP